DLPWLAELPLTFPWVALSLLFVMAGVVSPLAGILGCLGIILCIATAVLSAVVTDADGRPISAASRSKLALLYLIGVPVRSFRRWRADVIPVLPDVPRVPFSLRGRISFGVEHAQPIDSATLLSAMRAALIGFGLPVALTDGYKAWDLNILLPSAIREPINAIRLNDGSVVLVWHTTVEPIRAVEFALVFVILLAPLGGILFLLAVIIFTSAVVFRLRRVPSLIVAAARTVADARGLTITVSAGDSF
ncbi:MAG TPA: hypothetical protein VKR29_00765, partial [Candidatus Binataceae bacterium]|nr:hypothetical protein [Candidatus Binataceae bacterium]